MAEAQVEGREEEEEEECPKCPPAGAPAWMATFADMATLLMAFFVLILSFAEFNVPKFKQISGSLKNAFGIQRMVPVVEQPKGTTILSLNFSPSPAPAVTENITQQTTLEEKPELEIETKTKQCEKHTARLEVLKEERATIEEQINAAAEREIDIDATTNTLTEAQNELLEAEDQMMVLSTEISQTKQLIQDLEDKMVACWSLIKLQMFLTYDLDVGLFEKIRCW